MLGSGDSISLFSCVNYPAVGGAWDAVATTAAHAHNTLAKSKVRPKKKLKIKTYCERRVSWEIIVHKCFYKPSSTWLVFSLHSGVGKSIVPSDSHHLKSKSFNKII